MPEDLASRIINAQLTVTTAQQKWEYHVEAYRDTSRLNQLGESGWEACGAFPHEDDGTRVIFKRPLNS